MIVSPVHAFPGGNSMVKHGLKGIAIGSTLFAILLLSGCNELQPYRDIHYGYVRQYRPREW